MHARSRSWLWPLLGLLLTLSGAARAQAPALAGTTLDGRSFQLEQRRGRVVLVVLWKSDCAVCLSKLPELRANAQGWKHAPFDLVLVNLDAAAADAQSYERARHTVAADERGIYSLWQGQVQLPAAWRSGDKLPRSFVFDRTGKLAYSHEGRIPAEVWNQVADLLP
jgi:peroxiredoxin